MSSPARGPLPVRLSEGLDTTRASAWTAARGGFANIPSRLRGKFIDGASEHPASLTAERARRRGEMRG